MMRPSTTIALLAMLALAGGCPRGGDDTPTVGVRIDAQRYRVPLRDDDYALGGETPLVTIVLYTDYGCPPCAKSWKVMENLVEDYGEDVRVVFRSFTVPGYGRGEQAAEAAFAAGAQGKFWEMHRRLFESGRQFDRPSLRAHAEAVGLDVPQFTDDLDTGAHSGRRIQHRRQAKQLGIVGLPATFVNGLFLSGFADEKTWHGIVDEEIRNVRQMMTSGTPRAQVYTAIMETASTKRVAAPAGTEELKKELAEKQKELGSEPNLIAPDPRKRYAIDPGESAAIGPEDASVVVIEFLDFQCPFCRRAWSEELEALIEERKDKVRFVIKHLPLGMHPEAKGMAKAAIAAERQGKFWEMHKRLIEHPSTIGREDFVRFAERLELDKDKFLADLDDPEVAKAVDDDIRLAVSIGITGTPGFFINGRYARGYKPQQVPGMIAEELERAEKLQAEGVAPGEVFAKTMAEAVQPKDFPNQ